MNVNLKYYVLQVLDVDKWQTGLEIRKLAIEKKVGNKDWGPVSFLISLCSIKLASYWMSQATISSIYVVLYELEREGQVSRRKRPEPDYMLVDRGGHPRFEYKLLESGYKKRKPQASLIPEFG